MFPFKKEASFTIRSFNKNWSSGQVWPTVSARGMLPQKILTLQSLKMWFLAFWGLNWWHKSVSLIQEHAAFIHLFDLSVTQSIPTMITKLCTFAHKQILFKPVKKWLKYRVQMTAWCKTSGPLWKHIIIMFSFRFYDILFKLVAKLLVRADFYEQSSWSILLPVSAYWNP